jgi:Tol biopolymer transport system component
VITITRIFLRLTPFLALVCLALVGLSVLLGNLLPSDEIAFDSARGGDSDIYLLDTLHQITVPLRHSEADEYSPAWSPDGHYLAYISDSASDRQVFITSASGRDVHRLTSVPQSVTDPALAWSPDGQTLALITVDGESTTQGVFLIGADGGNLRRVSGNNGLAFAPTWSQDDEIAFSWSPVANTEIYVMNIDQPDSAHRITQHPLTDTAPSWSPDGQAIAFMSDRDGSGSDIYLMRPDGSDQRPITHHRATDTMPTWSGDSQQIAFTSNREGNFDLFMMELDGSGVRQLTFDRADDSHPAWRP